MVATVSVSCRIPSLGWPPLTLINIGDDQVPFMDGHCGRRSSFPSFELICRIGIVEFDQHLLVVNFRSPLIKCFDCQDPSLDGHRRPVSSLSKFIQFRMDTVDSDSFHDEQAPFLNGHRRPSILMKVPCFWGRTDRTGS